MGSRTTHSSNKHIEGAGAQKSADEPVRGVFLARLRVEALRVGLEELVQLRHEIRMGPVDLKPSQEVRLKRLQPRSVLQAAEGRIFIPAPRDLVPGLIEFLRAMWEPEPPDPPTD